MVLAPCVGFEVQVVLSVCSGCLCQWALSWLRVRPNRSSSPLVTAWCGAALPEAGQATGSFLNLSRLRPDDLTSWLGHCLTLFPSAWKIGGYGGGSSK